MNVWWKFKRTFFGRRTFLCLRQVFLSSVYFSFVFIKKQKFSVSILWLLSPSGVFLACWLCLCPVQNRNRCAIVYNFPWERDFGFAYAIFIEPFKETYIARVSCWFSFFYSHFIFRSFFFFHFFFSSFSHFLSLSTPFFFSLCFIFTSDLCLNLLRIYLIYFA